MLDDLILTDFLSFRIARVHAKLNAQAIALLSANAGITLQQWRVVALLGDPSLTTASALSRIGEIDKALLSRTLKALIATGLVANKRDPKDARQVRLLLTAKGRLLRERMLPIMRQRQRLLLGVLSPIERTSIYSALEKLEAVADNVTLDETDEEDLIDYA